MNPKERLDPQVLETLSAYLDGRLEGAEKAALENRLKKEESLRLYLEELRSVRNALRLLPLRRPPRSLAITPALAGIATRRSRIFSPRRMALGSALASLAFVFVLSLDIFSRGAFMTAATAPSVLSANEAAVAPRQSVDNTGGKSAATIQAPGLAATAAPLPATTPAPTVSVLGGGCGGCSPSETPTTEPSPTTTPSSTETPAANPLPAAAVSSSAGFQQPVRMDFQTVAPFLEAFFGLGAVLLAALAFIFWRRR